MSQSHTLSPRLESVLSHLAPVTSPKASDTITSITSSPTAASSTSTSTSTSTSSTSSSSSSSTPSITITPADIVIRRLTHDDYDKGYVELLSQLTKTGNVTKEMWNKRYQDISSYPEIFHIYVIEDIRSHRVIAAATLLIEPKFIHECGRVGHVEDVVVNTNYRGGKLGARVVEHLTTVAGEKGCYKVILDCETHNIPFYQKLGYKVNANHMAKYLH